MLAWFLSLIGFAKQPAVPDTRTAWQRDYDRGCE